MRILTLGPSFIQFAGLGYACQSILNGMIQGGANATLYAVATDGKKLPFYRLTLLPMLTRVGYKFLSPLLLARYTERRFLRNLRRGDIAYIWPGNSLEIFRKAKEKGCIVVAENINTHQATAKAILSAEYQRLAIKDMCKIGIADIQDENDKLRYVDFVFSPSSFVRHSLISAGVPSTSIIDTCYGLEEKDLIDSPRKEISRPKVAIFVGTLCLRKGVHLLLEYWKQANVDGVLMLVGKIDPDFKNVISQYINCPTIVFKPFVKDLRPIYSQADVFVIPSLEEGSPLVTYLAVGAGLPVLGTPMGSGGVIEHGSNGYVIEPHDARQWVSAIQSLFSDDLLRNQLSKNARTSASRYMWRDVGIKRYHDLISSINDMKDRKALH